jgi:hypothetical protein
MRPDDERLILLALHDSHAGRTIRRLAALLHSAVADSKARQLARIAPKQAGEWVSAGGYAIAAGAVSNALLLRVWPEAAVGYVPLPTTVILTLLGVALVCLPEPVAAAWQDSLVHRLWKRVLGRY